MLLLPLALKAQENSINTFSPYTMYGLGNMNYTGSVSFAAMGGASIGYRSGTSRTGGYVDYLTDIRVNTTNPASLSALTPGRSLVVDVGMTGGGFYLRERVGGRDVNSSFNTFNLNNVTVAFPIVRRLGFAINVSPYSQVGYRVQRDDNRHLADLGLMRDMYRGEGDVTELKAQMGWEIVPHRLSIGAELIYLWGDISRSYEARFYDYTGSGTYNELSSRSGVTASTNEKISRVLAGFGVQVTPIDAPKSRLTVGLTYRMGQKLRSRVTDYVPSNNIYGDAVRDSIYLSPMYLPHTAGVGLYFQRPKWAVGFDYVFQSWGQKNVLDMANGVDYINTNTYRLGAQYTPNRRDIGVKAANFFNRITYRVGLRYNDYYMTFGGKKLNEKAISVGLDIPFGSMKVSNVSLGLELGERGRLGTGLIRERYWKVSVGLMLFGRDYDYWFEKYKYN